MKYYFEGAGISAPVAGDGKEAPMIKPVSEESKVEWAELVAALCAYSSRTAFRSCPTADLWHGAEQL